jgi:alpha-N-arabinofuranosidase
MDGLSLHYYTVTKTWEDKGSATEFDDELYLQTLKKALRIDELITNHGAIMDRFDPERRIGMIVDEWGCWHNVEPGTNPGFLYQQNTMRDAMVAALSLNIFNRHSERVRMANIAQAVNVLQSIALTDGDKMLLTPTYHVFDLYQGHMDAELLQCMVECKSLKNGIGQLSVSASRKAEAITLTIANFTDETTVRIDGVNAKRVSGRILKGSPRAYNTFDEPNFVCPDSFGEVKLFDDYVEAKLPANSIVALSFN